MILSVNHLWNIGILLFTASSLVKAFGQYASKILGSYKLAMASAEVGGYVVGPNKEAFLACRSESIYYALMENFNRMAAIPFKGARGDVGSWNAIAALSPAEEVGNRIGWQDLAVQASNTYINGPHRAEQLIVVKSTTKVTNGEQVFLLEENQSTYIPIVIKHRLESPGKNNLEMIEVQAGSYLGEDDIVRSEDTYGRS
jgi:mannose-1-phosphate guanylyltransferase/mannose-6-phosphate isomerase